MKSGDFSRLSSTFMIKNNGKHQARTHIQSRTETEREELLLVASFLTSFRRSRTKTLTGRSDGQLFKPKQRSARGAGAEVSETDKEREIQKLTDTIWTAICQKSRNMSQSPHDWPSHTPQKQTRSSQALLITERDRTFLHLHRSDESILISTKHLF